MSLPQVGSIVFVTYKDEKETVEYKEPALVISQNIEAELLNVFLFTRTAKVLFTPNIKAGTGNGEWSTEI